MGLLLSFELWKENSIPRMTDPKAVGSKPSSRHRERFAV